MIISKEKKEIKEEILLEQKLKKEEDQHEQNEIHADIIKRKEKELDDVLRFFYFEKTKSSWIIGFIGLMFVFLFDKSELSGCDIGIITVFLLLSLIFALIAILGKKITIHMNFDSFFMSNNSRKNYLISKYKVLKENYKEANKHLEKKEIYVNLSIVFLFISLIIYVILYFKNIVVW